MGKGKARKADTPTTPTSLAKRERLPANIILNEDVGITDLESRDEIADIREKDHFVRALLVRVEKLADLSEEEQKKMIDDIGDLVTRASRFARAEIQIEKAKKNPKTLWELISKLLVELLPKQLQLEGASETEQLLEHLEQINRTLAREAERIKVAEDEKAASELRSVISRELQENDQEYRRFLREWAPLSKRVERLRNEKKLILEMMSASSTSKGGMHIWDDSIMVRLRNFFGPAIEREKVYMSDFIHSNNPTTRGVPEAEKDMTEFLGLLEERETALWKLMEVREDDAIKKRLSS